MRTLKLIQVWLVISIAISALSFPASAASEIYFVHNDHLGTPQVVTDKDQNVVWKSDKTPFGELENESGSLEQPIRFPGQYADSETGYYYNYYRDYDPSLGRYLQSDPIGLRGGMNTYAYVGGNPVNYIDPYGLYCLSPEAIGAISGAFGGLVGGALGGAAAGSAAGGVGALPGAVAGGISGLLSGALGGAIVTSSAGQVAAAGAVGSDGTGSGIVGSIAGGIVSSGLNSSGTTGPVAASGIGGAVAGVFTAGSTGAALAPAAAVGAIGGLAAAGAAALLKKGQDCDCEQ